LHRIILAFKAFFQLLFSGAFSPELLTELNLSKREPPKPAPKPLPAAKPSDGALQMLGILQRDSRLIDFLMEDIASYSDDQVGAAVRELHNQCRDSLSRYVVLQPVIDGVEGTFAQAPSKDPAVVKFVGNVPAKPPSGGTLRHKGWRASKVDLPAIPSSQDTAVIAPAEIEIE
jgi:hypothetical protein